MLDRAHLQAYSFPPRSPAKAPTTQTPRSASGAALLSPLSKYTNISLIASPTVSMGATGPNMFSTPASMWAEVPASSIFPSGEPSSQQMPMMMALPGSLAPAPQVQQMAVPQTCAFNLVTTPGGTQHQQQQQQLLPSNDILAQHDQGMQHYFAAPSSNGAQSMPIAMPQPHLPFTFGTAATQFGIPADFFDNLCV